MGSYSFKSVGKTTTDIVDNANAIISSPIMYGIKTPLREGNKFLFDVSYSFSDQISDNFRNLLLTNHGERLGLYNYGSNLRAILSDYVSLDDFDSKAISAIKQSISIWMPYIDLKDYISTPNLINVKKLKSISIVIIYDIPMLEISNASTNVVLYVT